MFGARTAVLMTRVPTVLATSFVRADRMTLRGPAIVVMEAAEHRGRVDSAVVVVIRRPVRDALTDSLMRPSSVEIDRVLGCDLAQMVFAGQEHMVEGLAAQAADKSFANGIHVRGPHRRL